MGLEDKELNGKQGKVGKFDQTTGRYAVFIGARNLAVKPANLEALKSSVRKALKLCRFGMSCWRPDCCFVHENENERASHWLRHWNSLCAADNKVVGSSLLAQRHDRGELWIPGTPKVPVSLGSPGLVSNVDTLAQLRTDLQLHGDRISQESAAIQEVRCDVADIRQKMLDSTASSSSHLQHLHDSIDDDFGDKGAALIAACKSVSMRVQNEVDALQTSWACFQTSCSELIEERLGDATKQLRGAENPELVNMCKEMLHHMSDLQTEVSDLKTNTFSASDINSQGTLVRG